MGSSAVTFSVIYFWLSSYSACLYPGSLCGSFQLAATMTRFRTSHCLPLVLHYRHTLLFAKTAYFPPRLWLPVSSFLCISSYEIKSNNMSYQSPHQFTFPEKRTQRYLQKGAAPRPPHPLHIDLPLPLQLGHAFDVSMDTVLGALCDKTCRKSASSELTSSAGSQRSDGSFLKICTSWCR